jgi:hypothetical protein
MPVIGCVALSWQPPSNKMSVIGWVALSWQPITFEFYAEPPRTPPLMRALGAAARTGSRNFAGTAVAGWQAVRDFATYPLGFRD